MIGPGLASDKSFYIFGVIGYSVFADEATAIFCDEQVIFQAYASKVFVGLELVEIDKLLAVSTCLPVVNERGNEIYARFVRHNKTLLQASAHTQAVGSKLFQVWSNFVVEAHVYLVKACLLYTSPSPRDRG